MCVRCDLQYVEGNGSGCCYCFRSPALQSGSGSLSPNIPQIFDKELTSPSFWLQALLWYCKCSFGNADKEPPFHTILLGTVTDSTVSVESKGKWFERTSFPKTQRSLFLPFFLTSASCYAEWVCLSWAIQSLWVYSYLSVDTFLELKICCLFTINTFPVTQIL